MKYICPAKNGLCPSKNRFDRTTWPAPAAKLFQARYTFYSIPKWRILRRAWDLGKRGQLALPYKQNDIFKRI